MRNTIKRQGRAAAQTNGPGAVERPLVVIKLRGGCVQGTVSNIKTEILVLDYDVGDGGLNPEDFDGIGSYPEPEGSQDPAEGHWADTLVDSEYAERLRCLYEAEPV